MAAETMADAGIKVMVVEAKPTPARKFLMAGKSGLNLTKDEPAHAFAQQISAPWLRDMLESFGPDQIRAWAGGLGIDLFVGSSGRIFPVGMKASPLLRAWLARLAGKGVTLQTRWRWLGFEGSRLVFDTPNGRQSLMARATVLALGGASWPRLGSDAAWVPWLAEKGVRIAPFRPANMGFGVDWSPHMIRHFGQPVKGCALQAGTLSVRGEFTLGAKGIEGGGIYALASAIRDGAALHIDLAPDRTHTDLSARLAQTRPGETLANRLRKGANLDPTRLALLMEWGRPLPGDPHALARLIKRLPACLTGPRPLSEAISSAGGIMGESLTSGLELTTLPAIFAAGEMLDWEAPTGGYLLTACLASGRHAGQSAANLLTR